MLTVKRCIAHRCAVQTLIFQTILKKLEHINGNQWWSTIDGYASDCCDLDLWPFHPKTK